MPHTGWHLEQLRRPCLAQRRAPSAALVRRHAHDRRDGARAIQDRIWPCTTRPHTFAGRFSRRSTMRRTIRSAAPAARDRESTGFAAVPARDRGRLSVDRRAPCAEPATRETADQITCIAPAAHERSVRPGRCREIDRPGAQLSPVPARAMRTCDPIARFARAKTPRRHAFVVMNMSVRCAAYI